MSFDYFVAVHKSRWPTGKQVQTALDQLGYPVALTDGSDSALSIVEGEYSLPVMFEGRAVQIEAQVSVASDFDEEDSLWGYWAEMAAPQFVISEGDYFLTLTFRSDADQVRAGLYLAAAIILSCDGYGFENQFEGHGGAEFAHEIAAEAADAESFK